MKSLSKGNSSRKDLLSSSSSLRESTTLPLSLIIQSESTYKDNSPRISNEKGRYGWAKQSEKEPRPAATAKVDRIPSGRLEGNLPASVYSGYYKGQKIGQNGMSKDDFDVSEQICDREQEKSSWVESMMVDQRSLPENKKTAHAQTKWWNHPEFEANSPGSDDDLIALLKVGTLLA